MGLWIGFEGGRGEKFNWAGGAAVKNQAGGGSVDVITGGSCDHTMIPQARGGGAMDRHDSNREDIFCYNSC